MVGHHWLTETVEHIVSAPRVGIRDGAADPRAIDQVRRLTGPSVVKSTTQAAAVHR